MKIRDNNIRLLSQKSFDVLIIGGGINGAVSAAALANKGVSVGLIEKKDFASSTSQESSNLVWGGIKYLENYEFTLVNDLCKSRNQLIREYPATVKEIRFLVAHEKSFRKGRYTLFLGTLFYWLIGRFFTKRPNFFTLNQLKDYEGIINRDNLDAGIEYSDAYLQDNDARFTFSFVRSALSHGCIAANYVEALSSGRDKSGWYITTVKNSITKKKFSIRSKIIINACGPEADLLNDENQITTSHKHLLSKGIHLIVDRLTESNRVLTFFADDGRLFFAIPMGPKTCIGTTDTRVESLPAVVTDEDRDFVLHNINKRLNLAKPLTRKDIIAERCGVRPLAVNTAGSSDNNQDWMQLSRKHATEVDKERNYISIFGGKLTDCLNVGEEISEIVEDMGIEFPFKKFKWYGEPGKAMYKEYLHEAKLMDLDGYTDPESSEPLSARLWRRYGHEAFYLLEDIRQDPANAQVIIKGAEYIRCEIHLAAKREMVIKLEDFLKRRSKIALITSKAKLKKAHGLKEACLILFGSDAHLRYEEYFAELEQGEAKPEETAKKSK